MAEQTGPEGWRKLIAPGLEAVRHNWRPFVTIQVGAMLVVLLYYTVPSFQASLKSLEAFKASVGLVFSAASTVFAGMILPEIARRATMRVKSKTTDLVFQVFFFSLIGLTVDLFYRLMTATFGSGADTATIIKKVLVDQILFTPFGTAVMSVVLFLWRDLDFSASATVSALQGGEFRRRYPAIAITSWCFWIPVLVAVYAMPTNLQFMLFLCAEACWSLLLVHMSRKKV